MKTSEKKSTGIQTEEMKVRLTFFEEVLGTASNNPEIHDEFIASKAPDAPNKNERIKEEIEALGVGEVVEKSMTIFPRMVVDGNSVPFVYDYQIKGFFKDSCKSLRGVKGSLSSKLTAYQKEIDGKVFVKERKIPFQNFGRVGECQRSLRAKTAQGERTALAHSETVQEGSFIEFTIKVYVASKCDLMSIVREWLDYGEDRGIGQWRNSGKGRFTWEEIK